MKKNIATFLTFLALVLVWLPVICFAQSNENIVNGLNGEDIVSQDYFDWGTVVATGGHVYSTISGLGGLAGRTYEYIWGPPPPAKIKSISVKKYPIINEKGDTIGYSSSDHRLVVLLDDGSVYLLDLDHDQTAAFGVLLDSVKYSNKPNDPASQTYMGGQGDDLFVLSSAHLYVSKDSATWHIDSAGLNGAHIYSISTDTLQRVYAATDKGLFKQESGTASFVKIASYEGVQNLEKVFVDRKNRLFIGLNGGGLYRSFDDGANWQLDTAGIGNVFVNYLADDAYNNLYVIIYDGTANTTHIYKSEGGTGVWNLSDTAIFNKTGNSINIRSLRGDSVMFAATSFGMFYSTDTGKTWHQRNAGIPSENISGIVKLQNGRLLVSGPLGIYARNIGDTAWSKAYPQRGFTSNLSLYDGGTGTIYTVDNTVKTNYEAGYILKSGDGGNSWSADTTGLYAVGGSLFFVDENGTQHIGNTFYGGSYPCRIWAKPKGSAWALDTAGFPVGNYSFTSAITSDKAGYLYVSGYFAGKKVMRRPVGGGTWETDTVGVPSSVSYFSQVAGNNGGVAAVSGGSLYYRGNTGWSAVPLPAGILFPTIRAISMDGSGYIYAAFATPTGRGVYFTGDLGQHWSYAGFDSADVNNLVSYGDTTYLLTRNMGAFLLTHASALPVSFSSLKAYPSGKGIQVEWSGYNEINISRYEVEKSANGSQFIKVAGMPAKGNSTANNNYSFFDAAPFNGDNFYRIKAVSKDAGIQYSGIVKVNVQNSTSGILIYPNPVPAKIINLQLNNIAAGKYILAIYSSPGQIVYATSINHPGGNAAMSVNAAKLSAGIYWIVVKNNNHSYIKAALLQ